MSDGEVIERVLIARCSNSTLSYDASSRTCKDN